MDNLLTETINISKIFSRIKKALDQVSIKIYKGEFLALVGESGSGKSTLAKIILGLINSDGGKINYYINEPNRKIQWIPQNTLSSFDPLLPLKTSLIEPLMSYKLADSRKSAFRTILKEGEYYDLPELWWEKYPKELSGGEIQRVAVLRSMILKPELIIADEITSALDTQRKSIILQMIDNIKKEYKSSILFITHDIGTIRNFADRIIVMKEGKIVEEGMTEEIFQNPKKEYTKKLLNAVYYLN